MMIVMMIMLMMMIDGANKASSIPFVNHAFRFTSCGLHPYSVRENF